jgi:hypothetical protein
MIIMGGGVSSSSNFSIKYLVSFKTLHISIPDLLGLYSRGAQIPATMLPKALNFFTLYNICGF